jgi:hypothetical protein
LEFCNNSPNAIIITHSFFFSKELRPCLPNLPGNDAHVRRALDLTQNKDGRESHRPEDKRFSSAALPRRICGEIIPVSRLAPLLASIALQSPPRSATAARGARDALLPVPAAARTRAAAALLPPRLRRAPVPRPRAHLPPGAPAATSFPLSPFPPPGRIGCGSPLAQTAAEIGRALMFCCS